MKKERCLNEIGLSRPAIILANRFVQRLDLHAQQLDDGRYFCVHEHLNAHHLFTHLRGEITLGTYLLNRKDQARFLFFDANDTHGLKRLVDLASNIKKENIPAHIEDSRRGGHLWIFLSNPTPGCYVRDFAKSIMDFYEVNNLEIFPKQDQLSEGPGSLIRLPFGIHRLTGRRYGFFLIGWQIFSPYYKRSNLYHVSS